MAHYKTLTKSKAKGIFKIVLKSISGKLIEKHQYNEREKAEQKYKELHLKYAKDLISSKSMVDRYDHMSADF